jgi:ketosteroid isomerase-like protein
VVTFDLAPPLKHAGFDRKMMEDWFKTWKGGIGYEVTDQVIEVSDTLAVARSLDHMRGTKIDGEKVDVWTRSTVCLRKEGQDWKVMHVHASVPFHMDGLLADSKLYLPALLALTRGMLPPAPHFAELAEHASQRGRRDLPSDARRSSAPFFGPNSGSLPA